MERISETKGTFLLLEAVRAVLAAIPSFVLLIVDDGRTTDKAVAIATRIAAPNHRILVWLHAAHLLVHPTVRDTCALAIDRRGAGE